MSASRLEALIVDPQSDDKTIVDSYDKLDSFKVDEDPKVWVKAVGDTRLTRFARGLSFQALFRRFVHPPTSLNSVVSMYRLQTIKGVISDQNLYTGSIPFDVRDLVDETGESRGMDLWSPGLAIEDRDFGVDLLLSRVVPVEELTAILEGRDAGTVEIIKIRTLDGIKVKKMWGFDD